MSKYTKDDIRRMVQEEDVSFIRLQFTDILGKMRNVAITTDRLEDALSGSCLFDSSCIEGFGDIEPSDMYLTPDLDTFEIFPWRPHQGSVARLICNIYMPDGTSFEGDPRRVLIKTLDEAAALGYTFYAGAKCEFFLFKTDDSGNPTLEPHDNAGYFDLAPEDNGENCRRDICLTLEEMGFKIEASHHEAAPGQHEIDFKYDNVLDTADRIITFKTIVKTLAKRHGLHATFMPKPISGIQGSGMHINLSVSKNGENVLYDESDELNLSQTAYSLIAGILKYTPEMMCITNPIVNSYKRLIPGFEAPCFISWSPTNRNPMLRTPSVRDPRKTVIELRNPDPTANPYLILAAYVKAGLGGISDGLTPPSAVNIDLAKISKAEREALGVKQLPVSLNNAIKFAEGSDFLTELLGRRLKAVYLAQKNKEYASYRATVNQWEIENYLTQY